ncbi:hypothetical protein VC83_07450 [Pseudogymnoascus destructans]|uniref:AGC-kinase C-terminal domain-containing protein n=2 Tax=Pseudogymnoascus destructans TaxID=655981 RepID=L8G046_PSED2|nr:uncharacterized protein VC83_07450 [Pseudogymnoascus destructans]ELR06512.1 hypothetical protein GMDG_02147 [Pseudogymnoascus destructans 20631-21]OAF56111.1 hypothetical protein VC83_07450 [Pseudogymnoascus destructans]
MFSYLKPHRRNPSSNPVSPISDRPHSFERTSQLTPEQHSHPYISRKLEDNSTPDGPRTPSDNPPFLPPIARVSSPEKKQSEPIRPNGAARPTEPKSFEQVPMSRLSNAGLYSSERPQYPPQNNYGQSGTSLRQPSGQGQGGGRLPFVTSAYLQSTHAHVARRPMGARMPSPPPTLPANPISNFDASQKSPSKTRRNLLNPMSLLARRRTAQPVPQLLAVPTGNFPTQLSPSDYDPRIRGTKVHDFSAPRPRPTVSHGKPAEAKTGQLQVDVKKDKTPEDGEWSPHTPAFQEDFEEEQHPAAGPHVRKANDFSDLAMPPRPAYAREAQSSKANTPDTSAAKPATPETEIAQNKPKENLPTVGPSGSCDTGLLEDEDTQTVRQASISSRRKHSKYSSSSLSSQRQLRNASLISNRDSSSTMKHMKSNSSRFSFDMIGAASQEKLLEDRHREKALRKQSETPEPDIGVFGEEEDYDYENMMDDDGLEERIPGVNADMDDDYDDDDDMFGQRCGIGGFTLPSTGLIGSLDPNKDYTPGDLDENRIGRGMSREPEAEAHGTLQEANGISYEDAGISPNIAQSRELSGLGLEGLGLDQDPVPVTEPLVPYRQSQIIAPRKVLDEDDMYFDDGMIDHNDYDPEGPELDESIFDNDDTDQYGRPLAPLSSLPTLYSPPLIHTITDSLNLSKRESADSQNQTAQQDQFPVEPLTVLSDTQPQADSPKQLQPAPMSLTQDTLSAYQSALAAAAYAAAASGRFRRDSTPRGNIGDEYEGDPNEANPYSPSIEDDFDYDDAFEDDPIIAEANAEALAFDDDGFYSQEFGFYSAPASTEALYANGSFFGPRGAEGIIRSQSGRVREPNLTPITERSEYSNRNSMMSLPQLASNMSHGSASLTSPGLAQLAGLLSDQEDENMTLSALLKLRRGQWGGSQSSLLASGGGSPSMASPGDDHSGGSRTGHLGQWQQNQMGCSPSGQLAP